MTLGEPTRHKAAFGSPIPAESGEPHTRGVSLAVPIYCPSANLESRHSPDCVRGFRNGTSSGGLARRILIDSGGG